MSTETRKLRVRMDRMVKHSNGMTIGSIKGVVLPDDLLYTEFDTPKGRFLGVVIQPQVLAEYVRQAGWGDPGRIDAIALNRWSLDDVTNVWEQHQQNLLKIGKGNHG